MEVIDGRGNFTVLISDKALPLRFLYLTFDLCSVCDTHNNDVELEAAAAGDPATGGRLRLLLPGRPPAGAADTVRF